LKIGLDIGSTTIKCVVLNENKEIIYRSYQRHFSQITQKTAQLLQEIRYAVPGCRLAELAISGSAGMGMADHCKIPFVQEVYATRIAASHRMPDADVIIELGGEDAKILFLTDGMEVRMNGSCAGGTGAFMDQMATLLNISLDEMNHQAESAEKIYTIASRCGVFAKSDIQPLLNQGVRKSDICASIFAAVVNQTIAGLAQGRPIAGKVVYLGGPLTFLPQLDASFDKALKTKGVCPEDSLYYVAIGAAYAADQTLSLEEVIRNLEQYQVSGQYDAIAPLFANKDEYHAFLERHRRASVDFADPGEYAGPAALGIDAGSTTVKAVVIGTQGEILCSLYQPNTGNPVPIIRDFLKDFYHHYPNITIQGATVTGYGEDIVKNAFRIDFGIVETIAHYRAARRFMPEVDFIIDIGGQDIKCFKIRHQAIDNIFLNEACSSGCGSFLQTFANALGYSISDFAALGLFAEKPVDLGSRCTVFMNSSVKQAQKDGASIENISAGLSISVVKNALYKVIRPTASEPIGRNIVAQGGTFLNDAVLRAFEQELKVDVVRPNIAGLMGAYGAALYAQEHGRESSTILSPEELEQFSHTVQTVSCGQCSNHCQLTVNRFSGGRSYISGNRCERPVTRKAADDSLNLYHYKYSLLRSMKSEAGRRGRIGLPMGLNMYEMLPFWHTLFTRLGFEVITSPESNRQLYLDGQATIPSDTVCFPAKLLHGHVQALIDQGIGTIFYPCMTYNMDEGLGDNHFNCPVVAYYPEVIAANMPGLDRRTLIFDYVGVHNERAFPGKFHKIISNYFPDIRPDEVKDAVQAAYTAYRKYLAAVRRQGWKIVSMARKAGKPIIVLAGRPYHMDPEINHGIDQLISGFGVAIISEDVLSEGVPRFRTHVLNQWTYHARLYAAARYLADKQDMNLVQLVSFGCGVDAITTDEVRDILEQEGKIYTQIKIDEITNLGTVKIRLRSLLAAIEQSPAAVKKTGVEQNHGRH
jgi:predicted CoA-substrate-specific enzyme activase